MLISRAAGVGKTRLVEKYAQALRWEGVRMLLGRCYEFARVLPYRPVVEALRRFVPVLTPAEGGIRTGVLWRPSGEVWPLRCPTKGLGSPVLPPLSVKLATVDRLCPMLFVLHRWQLRKGRRGLPALCEAAKRIGCAEATAAEPSRG